MIVRAVRRARGIPQGGARLRRARGRARTSRSGIASTTCRSRSSTRWASSACSAWSCPRSTAAAAADFTSLCVAIEELGRVDQSIGITLEAGVGLGINPILTFGTDGAEAAVAARPRRRPRARRLRPDRTRGRVGRRRDQDPRRTRRRSVGDQRRQGVHHQLGHRHHVGRHRHRPHRRRRRSRRSWSRRARPGFTVEPAYDKLGWHISDTHGLSFDDCRVPEANLLGARGHGIPAVPGRPRRRPHRDLGAGRRAGPGLPRPVA